MTEILISDAKTITLHALSSQNSEELTSINHLIGGAVLTGIFASFADINIFENAAYLATTASFSILPDIDYPRSLPGKVFPPLSKFLNRKFGHRTLTHSLIFLAVAVGLTAFIETVLNQPDRNFSVIAFIALLSHNILDAITKQGVPLFYPFSRRPCVIPATPEARLQTGHLKTEATAAVLFVILGITCQPLFLNGFWLQLNRTLATRQQLVDQFKRSDEILLVDYSFRRDFQILKGSGFCLSARKNQIVLFDTLNKQFERILTDDVVKSLVPNRSGIYSTTLTLTENFSGTPAALNDFLAGKRIVSISLHAKDEIEIIADAERVSGSVFNAEFVNFLQVFEQDRNAELKLKQLELIALTRDEQRKRKKYRDAQTEIELLNKRYATASDYQKIKIQQAINQLSKIEKPQKDDFERKKIELEIENLLRHQNNAVTCRVTYIN